MYGFHKRVEGYLKFPPPGDTIFGQAPLAKMSFSRQTPLIINEQPHIMICIYPLAMAK